MDNQLHPSHKKCMSIILMSALVAISLLYTQNISYAQNPERDNITFFRSALDERNAAIKILNSGSSPAIMTKNEISLMKQHLRQSLAKAELVDIALLNSKLPGWGDHFKSEFLAGVRQLLTGIEKSDNQKIMSGQRLMDNFGDWYEANMNRIRQLKPGK